VPHHVAEPGSGWITSTPARLPGGHANGEREGRLETLAISSRVGA